MAEAPRVKLKEELEVKGQICKECGRKAKGVVCTVPARGANISIEDLKPTYLCDEHHRQREQRDRKEQAAAAFRRQNRLQRQSKNATPMAPTPEVTPSSEQLDPEIQALMQSWKPKPTCEVCRILEIEPACPAKPESLPIQDVTRPELPPCPFGVVSVCVDCADTFEARELALERYGVYARELVQAAKRAKEAKRRTAAAADQAKIDEEAARRREPEVRNALKAKAIWSCRPLSAAALGLDALSDTA